MNLAHMIGRKKNRLKRLTRKLREMPTDGQKIDRKNCLIYELGKAGVQV